MINLQFCRSEVQHRFHWARIKMLYSFPKTLGENLFLAHLDCWQNSAACGCGTKVFIFLLAINQQFVLNI